MTGITVCGQELRFTPGYNSHVQNPMRKVLQIGLILALVCCGSIVLAWTYAHPGDGDPSGLKYVLWKHGLSKMDLDTATATMVGDANRDSIVLGRSRAQLQNRFGYLQTTSETSEYNRTCYQNSAWKSGNVAFIRRSPWLIVFDNDKATALVLMKGC